MAANVLYPGSLNSTPTTLSADYTVGDGFLAVADNSVLPAAPNIVVIAASSTDTTAVTYLYTGKGTGTLTGLTVLEGVDKNWDLGTPVARNYCNYDWQAVIDGLAGKAAATHTHAESDITGLTTDLAGKLANAGAANGNLYIGKADGTFALATLTQGANVTITNSDGGITIAAASGGVTFASVSGTAQQAAVNNGYIPLNAALTTITLPATAAVGDVVAITGYGAGLWKLAQNASQLIHFLSLVTTTGTGGYIQATTRYDTIIVRCVEANTTWVVENAVGNLDVI